MAQIINITSEALQQTIRRLLPSQQGFGEDLQASNVITPVIDITPSAEGSSVPAYLQQALAFGSQTAFDVFNTTDNLAGSPGFWRIIGTATGRTSSGDINASFQITDQSTAKEIWSFEMSGTSTIISFSESFDFIVFLRAGDQLQGVAGNPMHLKGSYRQIADANGTLISPSGFNPQ